MILAVLELLHKTLTCTKSKPLLYSMWVITSSTNLHNMQNYTHQKHQQTPSFPFLAPSLNLGVTGKISDSLLQFLALK